MTWTIKENIQKLSQKYFRDTVSVRRYLHAHPELSFEEKNTSRFIARKLKDYGIPFKKGIAGTGIAAWITPPSSAIGGRKKRNVIALRADMDALPISEQNIIPYKSKNQGVMHACGHDVHTACLLGAVRILNELRDELPGTVKLIFQPGEEKLPGGASLMIKEGVLKNPKPNAIIAQHVFPMLETGKVGFCKGKYMASSDEVYITVHGRGGHAALTGSYINPVLIAAEILTALGNQFMNPDQLKTPEIPTVLAFGKIMADGATNVIPDAAFMEGTFRTFDEEWRKKAHIRIAKTSGDIAEKHGGKCEVKIINGYPSLINDERLTERAMQFAIEYLGKENVIELKQWMTSEDFSYYSQKMPACFYRLGVRDERKGLTLPVHTSTFNIDEDAMKTGMGLMAWLAFRELSTG